MDRRTFLKLAATAAGAAVLPDVSFATKAFAAPASPVSPTFWCKPLPTSGVPVDADNARFLDWLRSHAPTFRLAGLNDPWGCPYATTARSNPLWNVWIRNANPRTSVIQSRGVRVPDSIASVVGLNNDSPVAIADVLNGYCVSLFETAADRSTRTLSCTSAGIYWFDSNELMRGDTCPDGDPRNVGHRGVPGFTFQVLRSDVHQADCGHALKVAIPGTGEWHCRPMVAHETPRNGIIGEGMRVRIKEAVDVAALGLAPAAVPIARTLQRYGAIVADNGGASAIVVKVQQGAAWADTGLTARSLRPITTDMLEFVERGWEPA